MQHARLRVAILLSAAGILGTCTQPPSLLEQIRQTGELRVVTRNSATAYDLDGNDPQGPEYQLLRGFADELGVRLRLLVVQKPSDVLPKLTTGRAHVAAAGLTINPDSERLVDFGPVYQQVTEHLIYRDGRRPPRDLSQLGSKRLEVPAGSNYVKTLARVQSRMPELVWTENPHAGQRELLNQVASGELDYTLVKSDMFALYRSFMPELRVAFNVAEGESVAWAFPKWGDGSLREAAERYFARIRADGELDRLLDDHYGHVASPNHLRTKHFLIDIRTRLPAYRQQFKAVAREFGLDWRLVAAVGYQESRWDPLAVSPTGVRGLMMLTEQTALRFGVEDRTDAMQSIRGGARYLADIMRRLPADLGELDRTAFALAAYNMGLGHLLDARRLARENEADWNRWLHVRPMVRKLADPAVAARTRHGQARGGEAVWFVDNVQTYFNVLAYMTRDELPLPDWMAPRSPAPLEVQAAPESSDATRLAARESPHGDNG